MNMIKLNNIMSIQEKFADDGLYDNLYRDIEIDVETRLRVSLLVVRYSSTFKEYMK